MGSTSWPFSDPVFDLPSDILRTNSANSNMLTRDQVCLPLHQICLEIRNKTKRDGSKCSSVLQHVTIERIGQESDSKTYNFSHYSFSVVYVFCASCTRPEHLSAFSTSYHPAHSYRYSHPQCRVRPPTSVVVYWACNPGVVNYNHQ